MSYLQDRRKNQKQKKYIIGAILVLVFLVFSITGLFSKMNGILQFFGSPFWKSKNFVVEKTNDTSYLLRNKKSVFSENKNLIEENQNLKNKIADYEILENENKNLKELFNRIQNPADYVLARVLSKPNKTPYDTLIIDIGKDESLHDGQKVFVGQSLPLGEIVEVYKDSALVKLYSSPGEITDAEIDVIGTSVELVGRGGGNFEMTVPKDLFVPNGVAVILPELNSKVLAIVVNTISEAKDPVNKIILKSPVNIQELKWIQILK